ncbi:hypothetical protein SAMN05444143_10510 [Flavobacterium succinicans]|jgi:uncharacterized membrane protein (DUF485 family)|uniref:Uncharacterized protein n=1 Tax=Flavobacterium succinicans TaxID=29536 RepID=A0A1I4VIQ1_9FLAO|nr:hypothetical protein [Flavobacterium sp. LM5]OOV27000.1 hypothetical protein BXU11_11675 [Flavobacterium sp. LM5]SFN01017.1 hypothetical protein SAMN05444143_10510 [Flavobacterium succinicans]
MIQNLVDTMKKKSPKERFLLVIGVLFFSLYLVMGLIVIFWKEFPFEMEFKYRIALGVLLIVYSFIRFNRFYSSNK